MKNYWKKWVRITGLLTRQIQEKEYASRHTTGANNLIMNGYMQGNLTKRTA